MHNGRDCAHGRQVGKCDTCDLIDAEQRISELEAQVEQLRDSMEDLMAFQVKHLDVWHNLPYDRCSALLKATPAQCLAEIKAQAGRDGFVECYFALRRAEYGDVFDLVKSADEYANQLRQQAKE